MRNILVAILLLFAVILSAGCVAEKTVEVGDEVFCLLYSELG